MDAPMNIRDLKYLVALADHGHFGRAADVCFVSQPALSMQIMKLEKNLGVKLLERTNKAFFLTDHGAIIVERARLILNQIEEIREIAKTAKDPFSGELKIGVFPTLAPYLLPLIIPKLTKLYPKLRFYLIEAQTTVLIEKLKQGLLHAALLSLPATETSLSGSVLFEEEFLLALPAQHPLAKAKTIGPHDLDHKDLLLLEEGHCLRDQALAFCHILHANENQNFKATSLETLRHMVAAGVGITLMPKLACITSESLVYVPFRAPKPSRAVGIYWRPTSTKQVLLEDLCLKIKAILKTTKTR
jgi:LysR family hydrogen peroxide-inducible transcriptional activator